MNTKLKPIPELDNLPEDKRDLLHHWIEELGYHKAVQKFREDSGVEVTYNKLYRYYQRVLHHQQFEQAEDDKLTMPDYLALLNGEPVAYDRAGIETVMKRAFTRACQPNIKPSELSALLRTRTAEEWDALATQVHLPLTRIRTSAAWMKSQHAQDACILEIDIPK